MKIGTSLSGYITTNELPDLDSFPDFSILDTYRDFNVGFAESGEVGARGYFGIDGDITSLTVVPEPVTILFLGLGGLALFSKRRA
jgi:hypothetical protein